jgi:hypothetical protein
MILGDKALVHFAGERIPVETLGHRDFRMWDPTDCPLCRDGRPVEDPYLSSLRCRQLIAAAEQEHEEEQ